MLKEEVGNKEAMISWKPAGIERGREKAGGGAKKKEREEGREGEERKREPVTGTAEREGRREEFEERKKNEDPGRREGGPQGCWSPRLSVPALDREQAA